MSEQHVWREHHYENHDYVTGIYSRCILCGSRKFVSVVNNEEDTILYKNSDPFCIWQDDEINCNEEIIRAVLE